MKPRSARVARRIMRSARLRDDLAAALWELRRVRRAIRFGDKLVATFGTHIDYMVDLLRKRDAEVDTTRSRLAAALWELRKLRRENDEGSP